MSVEILDGGTIRDFVEDERAFNVAVEKHFAGLDTDGDGLLSLSEMVVELRSLRLLVEKHDELPRLYNSLFLLLDHDGDGAVDLEDFKSETRKMMLAMADGMGFLAVQMVLEEDSFLKNAVDRESTKFAA